MSINFPNSPTQGQFYQPAGGYQYVYIDGVWRVVENPQGYTALPRNRVVNGAFQISQEFGNTTVGDTGYPSDQWRMDILAAGASIGNGRVQVVTPNGSRDRMRFNVVTGKPSLAAGDYHQIVQMIEGIQLADFRWGTAQARQAVLRFGWKSPAGTYSISILNGAANRNYIANFTISAAQANTDTERVIVVPGDTTGVWPVDTSRGMYVRFVTAVGTTYGNGVAGWQAGGASGTASNTNGIATNGNVIELFDVGLYLDPLNTGVPPRWEMPNEADELRACQRYFEYIGFTCINVGVPYTYTNTGVFKATKRVVPAVTVTGAAVGAATFSPVPGGPLEAIRQNVSGNLTDTTLLANARM